MNVFIVGLYCCCLKMKTYIHHLIFFYGVCIIQLVAEMNQSD